MALPEPTLAEVLEEARRRTDLTQVEVAERLRGLGVKVSNKTVENWFRGYYRDPRDGSSRRSEPSVSQYNVVVHVINERTTELGRTTILTAIALPSLEGLRGRDSNSQPTGSRLRALAPLIVDCVPRHREATSRR